MSSGLQDAGGKPVDQGWLAQMAVDLLERARTAEEPDYAACAKLLDLLSQKLLPKQVTAEGDMGREAAIKAAREAAAREAK